MQNVLNGLNGVPGVMGCLLVDEDGNALASSLPAMFDASSLVEISSTIANNVEGLHETTGGVGFMDMRFEHARIFIKKLKSSTLILLCEQGVNFQLLQISLNVANHKLEKLFAQTPKPAPISVKAPVQQAAPAAAAPQPKAAAGPVRTNDKGIILKTKIHEKSFMSGESWIGPKSAAAISNFFRGIEYKNLQLHNLRNGKTVKVPVTIVSSDPEGNYDDTIVISSSIAGDIEAKNGDDLVIVVSMSKGFFG